LIFLYFVSSKLKVGFGFIHGGFSGITIDAIGAHLGVQRTYEAIKQRYAWPCMYQNIYDYVTSCQICQTVKKDSTAKKAPLTSIPVQGLFARLHMDVISGLPTSKYKYKYIRLVTCGFSKWCECFPMRTQEAEEIADILFSQIFSRYGACRTLVSDRHASNLSKIINILCKMFNILHNISPVLITRKAMLLVKE